MIQPVDAVGMFNGSNALRSIDRTGAAAQVPQSPKVGTPENPRSADQVAVNPTNEPSSSAQDARTRQVVQGFNGSQTVQDPSATDTGTRGLRNLEANAMGAFRAAVMPTVPQMQSGQQSSNQQGNDPGGRQRQGQRGGGLMQRLAAGPDTPYRWSQSTGIGA